MNKSRKIAVFGGSGFIGSYVIDELLTKGFQPIVLVRKNSISKIQNDDIKIIQGSLNDNSSIKKTIKGCDAIIYAVGIIREDSKRGITFDKLHFEYFQRIVDIALQNHISRIIYISANGVKEKGTKYQSSKYKAEQYLQGNTESWTIFRPSVNGLFKLYQKWSFKSVPLSIE